MPGHGSMICERDVSVSCRRGADRIPLAVEIQFVALGAMELLDDIVTRRDLNLRIVIPTRVKADSFRGFQAGASQTLWWRTGGSPCGQGVHFVRTMMQHRFGPSQKRPGMGVKVGGCWPWPKSTTVAPGPKRRGSAASGCRPSGTGWCGSTPAGLTA